MGYLKDATGGFTAGLLTVAFFPFLSAVLVLALGHNPALERGAIPEAAHQQRRSGARDLARVHPAPVLRDLATGADPDAVASGDVVEKFDEPGDAAGATDEPVVQRQ